MQVTFLFKCNYGIIIHHFLFLGNTVTPFVQFICINVLNKASVFGLFTEAEPWRARLQGPAWQGAGAQGAPSQANGGTESPTSFTNVPNGATGPAAARCQPVCSLAEGFSLCLPSAQGTSWWKGCPWLLSMHSADKSQVGSRCGEKGWKIHAKTLPDSKLIYISTVKG